MARHGENIRKRSDGRWEGRYLIFHAEKGRKVYRSVYGHSYAQVRQKLDACKTEASGAEHTVCRIGEGVQEWLDTVQKEKKPSTYVKYSLVYEREIKERLADTDISNLTDDYVKSLYQDVSSASKLKIIYCVLNQILKYAADRYGIRIPVLKCADSGTRVRTVQVFTRAEQAKLISAGTRGRDPLCPAIFLCLCTGLRLGELCALQWSDIDFDNGLLSVNRTVQRLYAPTDGHKTQLLIGKPKSPCAKREIPLTEDAAQMLWRLRREKQYVWGGDAPLEPRKMQYHFKKILLQEQIPYKNFHTLRHTFATNCIEQGMDVKSLSEILGHANVQITLNRYVHPSLDTKRRYMDELITFYGQLLGQVS